jgi:SAM-dependent methyltransferase
MPLAYYSRAATEEFWSEHWGGQDVGELVAIARRSPLTALIESGLPDAGLILEGGCGLGQYVWLLRERGHRAVGADWSVGALARARGHAARAAGGAPFAAMDLAALALRDGAAAAYLSLGVVEHDPAGPARLLDEAHRVLAPGGRLVLSVPYVNGCRRLFAPVVARRQGQLRAGGGQFYQYAFTRREVRGFLAEAGFRVLAFAPYDPARILRKALGRRARHAPGPAPVPAPTAVLAGPTAVRATSAHEPDQPARRAGLPALARRLLYTPPALRLFGHMLLAVAEKR